MVAKDKKCDNPCRHKLNPVQLNLSKASLEHHKAMILYIQCSGPTADIQTQADGTSADTIPSLFS